MKETAREWMSTDATGAWGSRGADADATSHVLAPCGVARNAKREWWGWLLEIAEANMGY